MKIKTILFISVLLLSFSCSKEEKKTAKELDPIVVKADELTANNQGQSLVVTGKLEAKNHANISTRMMGFVNSVEVKTGQKVKKGDLLATIHSADLFAKKAQTSAGISQAEAAYNNAKKDLERYEALFEKKSATQKELDDMQTNFEVASAQLENAKQAKNEVKAHLSYSNLTAPFSGVISAVHLKEGDMANPGMPVLSIENPEQLEAVLMVSERDILSLDLQTEAEVYIKSLDKTISGKVAEISKSSNQTAGQYLVKIDLDKDEKEALSGMIVNVNFKQETNEKPGRERMIIPKKALVQKGQLQGVYVINENDTALLRWLRVRKTFEDQVEVLSGLSIGDKYVVETEDRLFNGAKVSLQ